VTDHGNEGSGMTGVGDGDWADRAIRNFFDIWINPEIERRLADGRLAKRFPLVAAQIIFNLDGSFPAVRLNDEVHAVVHGASTAGAFEPGKEYTTNDIARVDGIELTDNDPNAGHVTILILNGKLHCTFDFRYNAARVSELVAVADEFIDTAMAALEKGNLRPFVENLWSAAELLAKAFLMWGSDTKLLTSTGHGYIKAQLNMSGKFGNIERRWVRLLNEMTRLRNPARFLRGPLALTVDAARQMADDARAFSAFVRQNNPKRHAAGPGTAAPSMAV
jgi:hypothetical protein